MFSCTSLPFLVPNPPTHRKQSEPQTGERKSTPDLPAASAASYSGRPTDDVDFALAFGETPSCNGAVRGDAQGVNGRVLAWGPSMEIVAPRRTIRVALCQNVSKAVFSAGDNAVIRSASLHDPLRFVGRCTVTMKGRDRIAASPESGGSHEAMLPCTLSVESGSGCIALGKERFRGSMIIAGRKVFTVINCCDMDDYLRGVVPLEMGKRGGAELEALKAQAIVARTYAYLRMERHAAESYDVVETVADQVYGGAGVEAEETDLAVSATHDQVLVWHDSLAEVYYHSTCGGRTASIAEVWGKPYCEYLRSVSDTGPDGVPYCSCSPSFTWEESWKSGDLSKIVRSTSAQVAPGERFSGALQTIRVGDRFWCGRIKECAFTGTRGSIACGGDKIRFLLRRTGSGGPILRSANFTVMKNGPRTFVLQGKGYGHGVGMCQMGAIGRARAGQSFEQILAAYFPGTEIRLGRADARR
jgi:stage II sporulation protein D